MVGYHMLIFASGIERISEDYYEAATLDGANKAGPVPLHNTASFKGRI